MAAFGFDEVQIAKPGECPAHGFQSQSDEVGNIGSTDGKGKFGEVLFARGKLVRKPEQESTDAPFGIGTRGGQESLLPLLHDTGNETMKLSADQLVLGNAPQQMPVRDNAEDRILECDDRNGLRAGRGPEETHHITSQSKRRNPQTAVHRAHHGFRGTACNRKQMRERSPLLIENLTLLHSPSFDNDIREIRHLVRVKAASEA